MDDVFVINPVTVDDYSIIGTDVTDGDSAQMQNFIRHGLHYNFKEGGEGENVFVFVIVFLNNFTNNMSSSRCS